MRKDPSPFLAKTFFPGHSTDYFIIKIIKSITVDIQEMLIMTFNHFQAFLPFGPIRCQILKMLSADAVVKQARLFVSGKFFSRYSNVSQ
jgi:hypothetical protein